MQTIQQKIIALAVAAGYEGKGPLTVRGALDVLADAVSGSDVSVPDNLSGAIGSMSGLVYKAPSGTLEITENGEDIDVSSYAKVTVNVPNPSTGTLTITENGENIDVRQYAAVTVNVTTG